MSDAARDKSVAEVLRPFARLAITDTVQSGGILTLTNGERMVGIEAKAFIDAAELLKEIGS